MSFISFEFVSNLVHICYGRMYPVKLVSVNGSCERIISMHDFILYFMYLLINLSSYSEY
jgi:hypothetical protein